MGSLIRMATGDLKVVAEYPVLCAMLRDGDDDAWIEVQEVDDLQTRHLIRRRAILHVTETFDGPKLPASARILGG